MIGLPKAPFNIAEALRNGKAVVLLKLDSAITGVTGATTGVFTKAGNTLKNGDGLIYKTGTDLAGLTADKPYYVIDADSTAGTFKLAEDITVAADGTISGTAVTITTAGTAITFEPFLIQEGYQLNDAPDQTDSDLDLPDDSGVLRTVRSGQEKNSEKWTFDMYAIRRLLRIFGGALSGRRSGTCKLYLRDVDDAAGTCALVSEWFACVVTRDGGMQHGGGKDSKAVIRIKSTKQGPVIWSEAVTLS